MRKTSSAINATSATTIRLTLMSPSPTDSASGAIPPISMSSVCRLGSCPSSSENFKPTGIMTDSRIAPPIMTVAKNIHCDQRKLEASRLYKPNAVRAQPAAYNKLAMAVTISSGLMSLRRIIARSPSGIQPKKSM